MNKLYILFISAILFLAGCVDETPLETTSNLFVISAFLYEGEPAQNIQITSTLALGSTDSVAPPINDAIVYLIKNENRYLLEQNFEIPGYYKYTGSDLFINAGDIFKIEVNYNNVIAYGETSIPDRPENLLISDSVLAIPYISFQDIKSGLVNPDDYSIMINWENNDSSYYYVVLENLESVPTPIFDNVSLQRFTKSISSPSRRGDFVINPLTVSYYGRYRAVIYKVNQEYADLYESRQQDSRNLQEPLTNIINGLGVFSAFASDTVWFNIVQE
jgi:hypothetical protein